MCSTNPSLSWVLFLLGFAMHFFLQAKASVCSQSNGLKSVREWLALTWPVAVVRLFLCAMAFGLWLDKPEAFNKLLTAITGGALTDAMPLNRETFALFGYVADSMLDRVVSILGLGIEVPRLAPPH
jgi:ascorbate-specific PTS system EIIC-type component UlaA